jgi:hypothetical protein
MYNIYIYLDKNKNFINDKCNQKLNIFFFIYNLILNLKFLNVIIIITFFLLGNYHSYFYLFKKNSLIGYAFLQKKRKKYRFMTNNDLMLGNIYVFKNFRKKKFSYLICKILISKYKKEKRFKKLYYMCKKNNFASNKLAKKLGFSLINC